MAGGGGNANRRLKNTGLSRKSGGVHRGGVNGGVPTTKRDPDEKENWKKGLVT